MLPLMLHHANEHKKLHSCPAVWPVSPCIGFYTPSTSLGNFGNSSPNPNRSSTTQQTPHTRRAYLPDEKRVLRARFGVLETKYLNTPAPLHEPVARMENGARRRPFLIFVSLSRASAPLRCWWSSEPLESILPGILSGISSSFSFFIAFLFTFLIHDELVVGGISAAFHCPPVCISHFHPPFHMILGVFFLLAVLHSLT